MNFLIRFVLFLLLAHVPAQGMADAYIPGTGSSYSGNYSNSRYPSGGYASNRAGNGGSHASAGSGYAQDSRQNGAAWSTAGTGSRNAANQGGVNTSSDRLWHVHGLMSMRSGNSSSVHAPFATNYDLRTAPDRRDRTAAKDDPRFNQRGIAFDVNYYRNYNRHTRKRYGLTAPQNDSSLTKEQQEAAKKQYRRSISRIDNYHTPYPNTYYGDKVHPAIDRGRLVNVTHYWPVDASDHYPPAATVRHNYNPVKEVVNSRFVKDRYQPGYAFNPGYNRAPDKREMLRDNMMNDPKLGKPDRGWIKQEVNRVNKTDPRGGALKKREIRNPPGKQLAHGRGQEHGKGYSYEYAKMQDADLHMLQHKYDNFGHANPERVPAGKQSGIPADAFTP